MVPWTMAQHRAHVQSGLPVPTAACARLQAEPVCPPLPCAHPCQADPGMRMQRPGNSSALATVGALAGGDHREARTAARSAGRAVTTGTTAGASLITMMTAAASMVATRVGTRTAAHTSGSSLEDLRQKGVRGCARECSWRGGASQRCRPDRRRMKSGVRRRGCALHDDMEVVCTQVGAASPDSQHRAVATGTAHGRRTAFGLVIRTSSTDSHSALPRGSTEDPRRCGGRRLGRRGSGESPPSTQKIRLG